MDILAIVKNQWTYMLTGSLHINPVYTNDFLMDILAIVNNQWTYMLTGSLHINPVYTNDS